MYKWVKTPKPFFVSLLRPLPPYYVDQNNISCKLLAGRYYKLPSWWPEAVVTAPPDRVVTAPPDRVSSPLTDMHSIKTSSAAATTTPAPPPGNCSQKVENYKIPVFVCLCWISVIFKMTKFWWISTTLKFLNIHGSSSAKCHSKTRKNLKKNNAIKIRVDFLNQFYLNDLIDRKGTLINKQARLQDFREGAILPNKRFFPEKKLKGLRMAKI